MTKLLLLVMLLTSVTVLANEEDKRVFPQYCSNYSYGNQPVSYSYSSCVNNNFHSFGRELGGMYMSYCSNFGDTVNYSYLNCINSNFSTLSRELDIPYLAYCSNFRDDELSYSFQSCVSRNNDTVARYINDRDNQ